MQVRVFTPKGKSEDGKFALEVAEKVLPFYYEYFEVGYPLPKLDMLAIPDFSAGAMEVYFIFILFYFIFILFLFYFYFIFIRIGVV